MAAGWYCRIADRQVGPLTSQQLKAMAESGALRREDAIRQGTDGPWVPANRVKGLFAAAAANKRAANGSSRPVARPLETPPEPAESPNENILDTLADAAYDTQRLAAPKRAANSGGRHAPTTAAAAIVPHDRKAKQAAQKRLVVWIICACLGVCALALGVFAYQKFVGDRPAEAAHAVNTKPEASKPAAAKSAESKPPAADKPSLLANAVQKPAAVEKLTDQNGSVTVTVRTLALGMPPFVEKPDSVPASARYCVVRLSLQNTSAEKGVEYTPWSVQNALNAGVRLVDEHGKAYRAQYFGASALQGQARPATLEPKQETTDVLTFEAPPEGIEGLHLELPAGALGSTGKLAFDIPKRRFNQPEASAEAPKPAVAEKRAPVAVTTAGAAPMAESMSPVPAQLVPKGPPQREDPDNPPPDLGIGDVAPPKR